MYIFMEVGIEKIDNISAIGWTPDNNQQNSFVSVRII